jgi:hypothetical protein
VLDGILDERLKKEPWHADYQRLRFDIPRESRPRTVPGNEDFGISFELLDFVVQGLSSRKRPACDAGCHTLPKMSDAFRFRPLTLGSRGVQPVNGR